MKRNFNDLMLSLKKSITPADFFVDFSKVYLNIKDYERHLNLLNSLIGKENIEENSGERDEEIFFNYGDLWKRKRGRKLS